MNGIIWMAALLLAAPAAAADSLAQEKLAWSMLTLVGGETPGLPCTQSAEICAHLEALDQLKSKEPSLVRGDARTLPTDRAPDVLAVARRLPEGNRAPFIDTILIFNISAKPVEAMVMIDPRIDVSKSLWGRCPMPSVGGLLQVRLKPYEMLVCAGAVAVS